ncbi:PDK [Symbiodinium necroappetens]|uniref:PDK protein n=1 Tax=Symbiodinium necroappetens TaxID=1628268 RepID=A0A812PG45_9DINO|nr:PDK [Symbiodinium necroappetens]
MDWQSWGDGVHKPLLPCGTGAQKQTSVAHAVAMDNKPLPLLPILPPAYRAPQPRHEDDVVIQGRQKWAMARSGGEFLRPELQASFPPFTEHLRPQVLQASQALSSPRFGHGPKRFPEPCNPERAWALNETEIDPVSGLEMHEIPLNQPGWKHGTMQSQAEMEMAAPTAPEFLEEFGTRAEHFQDPLPSQDATSVPRWLERGRPMPAAQPRLHDQILRSVVSDLDKFEMAHPEVQALESPRSDAELVAVG